MLSKPDAVHNELNITRRHVYSKPCEFYIKETVANSSVSESNLNEGYELVRFLPCVVSVCKCMMQLLLVSRMANERRTNQFMVINKIRIQIMILIDFRVA
jgi:hypothetical protein